MLEQPIHQTLEQLQGSRIMVVDDSVTLRKRILEFMKIEGFETAEAGTGREVLPLAGEFHPDLILLDVIMPGMDGIEVCKQLRALKEYEQVPILMLTVKGSAYDIAEAFKAGANDYVRKPFGAEELLLRIRTHLKNRRLVKELEKVGRIINEFIGMAAYDIRTPLTNILGLTQVIRNLPKDGEQDRSFALDSMEAEGERILGLVNAMLDLSDIQSGRFTVVKEEIDLNLFLSDALRRANSLGISKGVSFQLEASHTTAIIPCDPHRIQQALDNLILNAIEHSPVDGSVTLKVYNQESQVCFEILDEGPGIPQEKLDKVFTPFFRDNTREDFTEGGVGLGLGISRKIIHEHNGGIGLKSTAQGGAAFYFTLPCDT